MFKEARKSSSDPIQEKLRENKTQWNKEVSVFIDNLINLKKLMNGWPSKFHMERSSIKEPVPSDPKSILGVLAGDFQDLAQRGNGLVAQQIEYSKQRKKKSPKTNSPTNQTVSTLSQQLTASSTYELESLASNALTRFYSKLKSPWFGPKDELRIKKYRVSMLNSCADLHKQLSKFQESILGSSPESIFSASKMLGKIENQVNFILNTISAYKSLLPKEQNDKEKSSDLQLEEVESIISDFKKNYLNFTDLNVTLVQQLNDDISKFENSSIEDQKKLIPVILQNYKHIIDDFNRKNGTFAKSLSEALFAKKASLETLSQEFLTKWFKKLIHQLSPFDKTSALRLDIFKATEDALKILNNIMDSLEVDFNVENLVNEANELYGNLSIIRSLMTPLEDTIKNNMFDKTFINLLRRNDITEYDFSLDKKQKEKLENILQNKKFKDLSSLYQRK